MFPASTAPLWLFFLMVFGIIVVPGMDMAFVAASSLRGGRRSGALAVAGIVAGGVVHVAAAALGLGLLLQVVPGLFNAVLLAGAGYLAWIGISLMRHARSPSGNAGEGSEGAEGGLPPARAAASPWLTFRQAMLTSLLNPKAYIFMLAVFPQFMRPDQGGAVMRALVMGLVIWPTQAVVYGTVAAMAARAGSGLAQRPRAQAALLQAVGLLLIAGAAFTAWTGWRA